VEKSTMLLEIVPVTEQDLPAFGNLFQLYLYEYTGFTTWDVQADGRYHDPDFESGFDAPNRYLFFAKVDGKLAGLAMVENCTEDNVNFTLHLREFFVMRKFQRQGIGTQFAVTLFNRFRGHWLVGQLLTNTRAIAFWRKVIADYTDGHFTETELKEKGENFHRFDNTLKVGE
jgi:predicted acetyltransferase